MVIKFGHIIEYKKKNIFFVNHAENETWNLAPDHFFLKKSLYQVKAKSLQLSFNIIR